MTKPYWFKLTELDEPSHMLKHKKPYLVILLSIYSLLATLGFVCFATNQHSEDIPTVVQTPIECPTTITNPSINPKDDDEDYEDTED